MRKNTVEADRPQMIIYYGACILHARKIEVRIETHTHSEYVILLLFYSNIGYSKSSQCYDMCTSPVLVLVLVIFLLSVAILRT